MGAPVTEDFLLAHVTDPHLPPPVAASPAMWFSKRGLSMLSWQRSRRRRHLRAVCDAVVADMRAASPDGVVVTGDLTNFATEAEFAQGAAWLAGLGPEGTVSFVPGNHDAIVPDALEAGTRHLLPWLTGDDGRDGWPWLRRRGPLALIGLSTAVPTPPFSAAGAVGARQIEAAADLLRATRGEGLCRVVLLHHSPADNCSARKSLRDRVALRAMLAREGAELVLHGHTHRAEFTVLRGPERRVLALGAPSASMRFGRRRVPGAWRALRISSAGGGLWRLDVRERGIGVDGRIEDRVRLVFTL